MNSAIKMTLTKEAFNACADLTKSSEFSMLYALCGTKLGEIRVESWEEFSEDIIKESVKLNKNELNITVTENEITVEVSMHVLHETLGFMKKIAPIITGVVSTIKSAYELLCMTAEKFTADLTKAIMKPKRK